jgi:hypothetical protein
MDHGKALTEYNTFHYPLLHIVGLLCHRFVQFKVEVPCFRTLSPSLSIMYDNHTKSSTEIYDSHAFCIYCWDWIPHNWALEMHRITIGAYRRMCGCVQIYRHNRDINRKMVVRLILCCMSSPSQFGLVCFLKLRHTRTTISSAHTISIQYSTISNTIQTYAHTISSAYNKQYNTDIRAYNKQRNVNNPCIYRVVCTLICEHTCGCTHTSIRITCVEGGDAANMPDVIVLMVVLEVELGVAHYTNTARVHTCLGSWVCMCSSFSYLPVSPTLLMWHVGCV